MGFWDDFLGWFGVSSAVGKPYSPIEAAAWKRVEAREMFVPMDLVNEVTSPHRSTDELRAALAAVRALGPSGRLSAWNYMQTGHVYHPVGVDPATFVGRPSSRPPPARSIPPFTPPPAATTAPSRPASARPAAPLSSRAPAPFVPGPSPYEAGDILGLSAEQLRERALRVAPWRTAWIGRIDTIPPQSDERTAIIDRGLILRGYLTPDQIREIHRVGDLWLKHHDAVQMANSLASAAAKRAVEDDKAANAAAKADKKRLAAERKAARATAIAKRRAEDIVFLGRGVSARLGDRRANIEALASSSLPVLASPADVARALGLTIRELRHLCFHSEASEKTHYVYFEVPKRSGGTRLLAAPHRRLAKAQRWVLDNVLARVAATAHAHGFVAGRSTVTNARPHVGKSVVVNLDLKDFFPSITFPRVRGLFESLGYSPAAATVLALLVTESPRMAVEHDGRRYWAAMGDRALPQGACTSPAISNLVTRKLDRRLAGAVAKAGWAYTRYADDITVSAGKAQRRQVTLLAARVRHVVREEGFTVHEKKGRVQRAASRQEVTGIGVNDKLSLPRTEVRRLRAILHAAKKTGLAAQNRDGREAFEAWLRGKIAYLQMVDPAQGKRLADALAALPEG